MGLKRVQGKVGHDRSSSSGGKGFFIESAFGSGILGLDVSELIGRKDQNLKRGGEQR
jgi:hypothetical protein